MRDLVALHSCKPLELIVMTLISVSLVDAYWHLVSYRCISLITNEIECHMVYLLAIRFPSFTKYLFCSSVPLSGLFVSFTNSDMNRLPKIVFCWDYKQGRQGPFFKDVIGCVIFLLVHFNDFSFLKQRFNSTCPKGYNLLPFFSLG